MLWLLNQQLHIHVININPYHERNFKILKKFFEGFDFY